MTPVLVLGALLTAAAPPPALVELQAAAKKLSEVKLEEKGEAKVDAIRHRKGALAALVGASRPLLRGSNDVPARMEAHLALAEAHEAFAHELFAAKPPAAAKGESLRAAWAEQTATTVERSLETARAHLRSCVELGQADKGVAARCAKLLEKVGAGKKAPKGNPAAIAAARMGELQGCFDAHAAQSEEGRREVELSARLSIDGAGRVEDVVLAPRRDDAPALYDCVSNGLWIWTFPGVADVELELPIRLKGPSSR